MKSEQGGPLREANWNEQLTFLYASEPIGLLDWGLFLLRHRVTASRSTSISASQPWLHIDHAVDILPDRSKCFISGKKH